jgi:hypothetical protein
MTKRKRKRGENSKQENMSALSGKMEIRRVQ